MCRVSPEFVERHLQCIRRSMRSANEGLSSMPTHRRPRPLGSEQSRTRASVWVQNHVLGAACDRHASTRERERHHCRMVIQVTICALDRLGGYLPHGTQSSTIGADNRACVVIVILLLRKKKHRLVSLGGAVTNRLGVGIRFVPDHFATDPPTGILKRQCDTPRDTDQILGLQVLPVYADERSWRVHGFFDQGRDNAGSPTYRSRLR